MTILDDIKAALFQMQDIGYRNFQYKLIPTVDPQNIIGVRTPALRKYAKQLCKRTDIVAFLEDLPHTYFDENQLHAFILSEMKEFNVCVSCINSFLPYIDNWATCDQLSPKIFKKHTEALLPCIKLWIDSDHIYTVRFGIGMLMQHYLDEHFSCEYPETVASIHSDEYYINMMIAWYFATALAKQYDHVIQYISDKKLDKWVHNKTIQKAIESYRISDEQKVALKTMRIR